jgi:hypothetical protein
MGRGSASAGATRHVASSQPQEQASPRTRRAKVPAKATLHWQVVTARVGGDAAPPRLPLAVCQGPGARGRVDPEPASRCVVGTHLVTPCGLSDWGTARMCQ